MKFLVTPKMGTPINATGCGTQTCNYTCNYICNLCNNCGTRCTTNCFLGIDPVDPCLLA